MTRVSFLMPTYNRAGYIAESIEALLAQMTPDDELVVIDDGSSDGTEEVVAHYAGRLRYLRQGNAGKSVALNRGMSCTDGAFVWICDDDDIVRPNMVERLTEEIEAVRVDMVFGRYTRFRMENGQRIEMGTGYWPDLARGSIARHILEDSFVMHNASLVRREAYERLGPFNPRMLRSQDYEMFVRLALKASIGFVDEIVFDQRKHEGARGPAKVSHAASASDDVWQSYDAMIFQDFRTKVPLSYFEAMFASPRSQLRNRAALLQRATILARHGLWDEALSDWEDSLDVAPAIGLTREENEILLRAVAGKHGFHGALEPETFDRLKRLSTHPFGAQIRKALSDGLLWCLRSEEREVREDARTYLQKSGWVGPVFRWGRRRANLAPTLPDYVTELTRVPPVLGDGSHAT